MKIACLLITHLGIKDEMRRRPDLVGRNIILYRPDSGARSAKTLGRSIKSVVFDVSSGVSGIPGGMPLSAALSKSPDSIVLQADLERYRKVFARIMSDLRRIAPAVQGAGLGKVFVDMTGLEYMYGGEAKVVTRMLETAPSLFHPRVGIAKGKFPAYVAALSSDPGRATKIPDNPTGTADFLASFPVDVLPVGWQMIMELHRFAIHTLGELAAQDLGNLQTRFGPGGRKSWELARGIDPDRVIELKKNDVDDEYVTLPFAYASREVLFTAVDALLRRAYTRPGLKGKYALKFLLKCTVVGSRPWSREIVIKEAAASASAASFSIRSVLSDIELPGLIEDVALSVSGFMGEHGVQARAFTDVREQIQDRLNRLAKVDRHLQAKTGGRKSLYRVVEVDPIHPVPEMRFVQVPVDPLSVESVRSINMPEEVKVGESKGIPVSVALPGKGSVTVRARAVDMWKMDLWWLHRPVRRVYYVLKLDGSAPLTVFRDTLGERGLITEKHRETAVTGHRWYRQDY